MRALLRLFVMTVVLFPLIAGATVINIPDDYPTIQEGINHGADGDTVLVQPDIYYENLNFNGHDITLASLFLTTGDTAYISTTIIDGDSAGSVITFESGEDSTAQVVGFTIQNGRADEGGGIYCKGSSPTISNNIINDNYSTGWWGGGGILCSSSNATISSNTISRNSAVVAYAEGGGICCEYSSPTISANTITDNSAEFGGGICCWRGRLKISGNTFNGNSATFGGGICCEYSSSTISDNAFSGNSASFRGGGIYCFVSSPMISNNIISGNSASTGGGISCDDDEDKRAIVRIRPEFTMSDNIISKNWANRGSGISCFPSTPVIIKNTISGNSATYGGGVYCYYYSNPAITNSVLWGNIAPNGPEIFVGYASDPTVRYCDVNGGWPGFGNIDADPLFAGPFNDDLHLRWHSPCINAGDPSLTDPDGTRSDIGAFYFNLAVLGIVEVYPRDEPIVIPPQGGEIRYDGGVLNLSRGNLTVDIWAQAFVPGLNRPYRLWRYNDVTIPFADSIIRADLVEHVPGYAPSGDYTFVTYIGDFPFSIIDSSCLYFGKEGAIYSSAEGYDWQTLKGWFNSRSELSEATLPTQYSLSRNYPNPFNATTVINYQSPVDAYVKLEIYNLSGQKVATLVDERQGAGYKSVSWDASSVSSGLYFYRLSAGDYTETRRMMLVK